MHLSATALVPAELAFLKMMQKLVVFDSTSHFHVVLVVLLFKVGADGVFSYAAARAAVGVLGLPLHRLPVTPLLSSTLQYEYRIRYMYGKPFDVDP